MNTWSEKPGSQFILCSYHEEFVDDLRKGNNEPANAKEGRAGT